MGSIVYFVDGHRFTTDSAELTVRDLLQQVGKAEDQFYVERNNVEFRDPDQETEMRDGDHFATRPRDGDHPMPNAIRYKVNGEEQTTIHSKLSVEQILRNAGSSASIDISQIDSYFLQNIEEGQRYDGLSDEVSIHPDDQFLAVHLGRTTVA